MIKITLTAANMGPDATEQDFDAWAAYVADHVDAALGFEVNHVELAPFANGPSEDRIEGATAAQCEAIRRYLAVDGWEAFCVSFIAIP